MIMFFTIVIVIGLAVTGLSMLIYAVCAASEGVEDDRGFYLTKPGGARKTSAGVLPSAADMAFFKR